MNNKIYEKVSKFLQKEYIENISDISVYQYDDGTYEFFDRYLIYKVENSYKVSLRFNSTEKVFSNLKSAVAWCIFDDKNKVSVTQRIEYLDLLLTGIEGNILVHKRLFKNAKDNESKLIYLAKLSEDQLKRKNYLEEMIKYISESKLLQTQKFANK